MESKVALSPLAILILGIGAPFVGSMVKDRLSSGENSASIQVQVQTLQEQIKDMAKRADEDTKRLDQSKVSHEEFTLFANQMQGDLRDIKTSLSVLTEERRRR